MHHPTHPAAPNRATRPKGRSRRLGRTRFGAVASTGIAALVLAGCTLGAGDNGTTTEPEDTAADEQETTEEQTPGTVQVVTHDSFALSEELLDQFETDTGYTLQFSAPGDGGALVNQLILTQDSPLGDVAYGIDNSFASRGIAEGVFADYDAPGLPPSAEQYLIEGGSELTPIDVGDVCLNIDNAYFDEAGIEAPQTLSDLTEPEYSDQVVVTNPATSSPGLAFLLATVAEFGDDWTTYWQDLVDNGLLAVDSWSTAYSEEFSGSVCQGPRPVGPSYSTSPRFEVGPDGEAPQTEAMLSSCFPQVEYAWVLEGANNPEVGQASIDFLLSEPVQADIPG